MLSGYQINAAVYLVLYSSESIILLSIILLWEWVWKALQYCEFLWSDAKRLTEIRRKVVTPDVNGCESHLAW